MTPSLVPIILCGGSGTRLWPMSREDLPKQFLPLISTRSMLQDTVLRSVTLASALQPVIVCSETHRFLASAQLREVGIEPSYILLEPLTRNTAPALAAAALAVEKFHPNGLMLVLPADHLIQDGPAFARAVTSAALAATSGALATLGIVPQGPETGYGYIEQGDSAEQAGCFNVRRFVEKPDLATAERFIAKGSFLWNSGIFVMTARRYLQELERFSPVIFEAASNAWAKRQDDQEFCRLDVASYRACPSDSIDYAVMERTSGAVVVPVDMGWSDVGSWATLWEIESKDGDGNTIRGDVETHDTRNSYLRAESRLLSVSGLDNVIVVETSDAVLVTTRDKAQSVKEIVSRLQGENRTEHLNHQRVYRPWGYYESVDDSSDHPTSNTSRYKVKRLMVKPSEALSLQLHHRRTEHWVVVSGTARVTIGERILTLSRDESTYIPRETKHRLENPGTEPLYLIEVQSGDYLGEDDIVRFEDRYKRT